jgi:hypothetical protein
MGLKRDHVMLLAQMICALRRSQTLTFTAEGGSTSFAIKPDRETRQPTLHMKTVSIYRGHRAETPWSFCFWSIDDLFNETAQFTNEEIEALPEIDDIAAHDPVVRTILCLLSAGQFEIRGRQYVLMPRPHPRNHDLPTAILMRQRSPPHGR